MRRGLLVLLLAGITAAAWTAVGSQAGTKHSSSGSSVTIANVAGMSWTCGFNPFNSTVQFLSFGPDLRGARVRERAQERCADSVARVEVQVVEPRQEADVHDQERRQVVGREAAHRSRRPLHVPAPQEAQGARPPGRVVGAEEREPQGEQQGRLQLQVPRSAVLLLRRRPDADRAEAHLVQDREPGQVFGQDPGGERSLHRARE